MAKQSSAYPLRLDETVHKKIKVIAKENDRTFRSQVEHILKKYIMEYERQHGEVILADTPTVAPYKEKS